MDHNGTVGLKQIHSMKVKIGNCMYFSLSYKVDNKFYLYQKFIYFLTNKIIFIHWFALKENFQSTLFIRKPKIHFTFIENLLVKANSTSELFWMVKIFQINIWNMKIVGESLGQVSWGKRDISVCMRVYFWYVWSNILTKKEKLKCHIYHYTPLELHYSYTQSDPGMHN